MTKILLTGATGLIGAEVTANIKEPLRILGRRPKAGLGLATEIVAGPQQWPEVIARERPEILISCLGTTRRKAGSNEAFAAVDRDLVLEVAKAAKQAGTPQMITISSVGADADSNNFYLSVKGQAEDGLQALGFDRLDILRPGLLRGNRDEHRPGESLALMIAPLVDSLIPHRWSRYRSISAHEVGQAIIALTSKREQGKFIHENDSIIALAG